MVLTKTPLSEKFKWPSSSLKTTDNPLPHHNNPLFRSSMEPECLPNVCTAGTFYDSVNTKKSKKNVILKYSRRLALKLRWGMANNQKTLPALVTTCQTFREAVTSWAPGLKRWHYSMKTTNSLVTFIFKGAVWGAWGPWSSTGHSWAWVCRQHVKGDLVSDGDSNELSQESLLIISWYKYEKWVSSVVIRSDFADAG